MRIEGNPFVRSNTPADVLHGFVCSTNFGDMLLSRITIDIVRPGLPRAILSLPFGSRTFVRCAGGDCATGLRTFLGAVALLGGRFLETSTATPPQREPLGQREPKRTAQ